MYAELKTHLCEEDINLFILVPQVLFDQRTNFIISLLKKTIIIMYIRHHRWFLIWKNQAIKILYFFDEGSGSMEESNAIIAVLQ